MKQSAREKNETKKWRFLLGILTVILAAGGILCGTGVLAAPVFPSGATVQGISVSEQSVQQASETLQKAAEEYKLTVHFAQSNRTFSAKELGLTVAALTANSSVERMEDQVRRFHPALAVLTDEAAARDALASGKLAGLSMDVLANELAGTGLGDNAGLNSDLFGMKGFTVSPHIGGSTHEAYDGIGAFIVEKAAEFYGLKK